MALPARSCSVAILVGLLFVLFVSLWVVDDGLYGCCWCGLFEVGTCAKAS